MSEEYTYGIKKSQLNENAPVKLHKMGGQPICQEYLVSSALTQNYVLISSFIILMINIFFIFTTETLVKWIGLHYSTNERTVTAFAISSIIFTNSVVMPCWISFDKYALGPAWFSNTAPLLTTNLVFLAIMPIILYGIEVQVLKIGRWLKAKIWYRGQANNNTDNIKFLEMNAGPEYEFQRKTGSLNCLLFTTIVFG